MTCLFSSCLAGLCFRWVSSIEVYSSTLNMVQKSAKSDWSLTVGMTPRTKTSFKVALQKGRSVQTWPLRDAPCRDGRLETEVAGKARA